MNKLCDYIWSCFSSINSGYLFLHFSEISKITSGSKIFIPDFTRKKYVYFGINNIFISYLYMNIGKKHDKLSKYKERKEPSCILIALFYVKTFKSHYLFHTMSRNLSLKRMKEGNGLKTKGKMWTHEVMRFILYSFTRLEKM